MSQIDINGLNEYIIENDLLIEVLEEIGFSPKSKGRYISFSNLDGDNPTAICVYKDTLKVKNYTRGYSGDLITLIQESLNTDFLSALKILTDITGYSEFKTSKKDYLKILMDIEKSSEKIDNLELPILDEEVLKNYKASPNKLWLDDGINVDTQCEFEILYDVLSCSIIIPIRDENGRLVGIKNRKNTSEDVYMKYYYSHKVEKNKILYNLYKAKEYIKEKNEVIVVESEKSVMKLWQNNIRNVVAISGSDMSFNQILKLERLKCNIILAYDKDKDWEHMTKEKNKLMVNTKYVYDDDDLLNEKDSPIDKGIEIFLKIFENKY